jgi:hypothetical protein
MTLSSVGALEIDTVGTAAINIGKQGVAKTITIGNDASTKVDVNAIAIELDSAGAMTLSSGGVLNIDTVGAGSPRAINLGTESAAKTITIGNDASTKVDVNALAIELDSAAAMTLSSGGALDIDTVGTDAINLGTENAAKTITIGNDTTSSALILKSGTGGITNVGNTYLDTGVRSGFEASATIATFKSLDPGGDALVAGHAVVVADNSMGVRHADAADDHIIGILLEGAEENEPVKVQIGGLMLAKFSGTEPAFGQLATVADGGTLVNADSDGVAGGADHRFAIVKARNISAGLSLVMWMRGDAQ